jgi:DNA polymerase-1
MSESALTVYGAELLVNPREYELGEICVIDCETDGSDSHNFVGIGIACDSNRVHYFSSLDSNLRNKLEQVKLVGHNLKGDAKWLRQWGCNIRPEQLLADTMLMSYVIDTTKESHGLKELAKEILKREYPSYKTIVGKGKKKKTLDKQPLEVVAAYCSADVRCTYDLWQYFNNKLTPLQRKVLDNLDMPLMRLLYEMENTGIRVDRGYLQTLQKQFHADTSRMEASLRTTGLENSRSPKQVKEWLATHGVVVESTDKRVLQQFEDNELVKQLLEYRVAHKLLTTYVGPLLELSTKDERIHTNFNQVTYEQSDDSWKGIRTGRLSSSGPNLQNIPTRTDAGRLLRRAFIPDRGFDLICADFEQIEYRLLAHFANDELLIEAFLNGRDVHEETGKAIGGDRKLGKNINFAAIYGAGPDKVASLCKISKGQAEEFLRAYWEKLPKVRRWIDEVKKKAHAQKGVSTLYGRWIALPDINSYVEPVRWHWERAAVNYVIQGSAAEILKLAMLKCNESGFKPISTIHDEILFNSSNVEADKRSIEEIMNNIVTLKVPIVAKVGHGKTWDEAK